MQNKPCKGIRSKVIANSIYVGDQSLDNDDCHFNGTWLKFLTRVTSNLKATILDLNTSISSELPIGLKQR